MMLSYSKNHLALDLFEIGKSILSNARTANLTKKSLTEDYGLFKIVSEIYDFKVGHLNYRIEDLANNAVYSHDDRKFSISSTKNIVNYTVTFLWRLRVMDIDIAVGTGYVELKSKSFSMSIILANPNTEPFMGDINVEFDVGTVFLNGIGATESMKEWIRKHITTNTTKEISDTISQNKEYIKENFITDFRKAEGKVNNKNMMYMNVPLDTKEAHDYIWISFQTKVLIDRKLNYTMETSYTLTEKPSTRLAVYLSPEHILASLKLAYTNEKIPITFNDSDYKGTVKDFYSVMPQLYTQYNKDSKTNLSCTLSSLNMNKTNKLVKETLRCEFGVDCDVFLTTEMNATLKLIPKSSNNDDHYIGEIKETKLEAIETVPSNIGIRLFISQFFLTYMTSIKGIVMNAPFIKYDYNKLIPKVETTEEYYALLFDLN